MRDERFVVGKRQAVAIALLGLAIQAGAGQLEDWLHEAIQANPSLASAKLATEAAREGARSRQAWDPPQFGVEFFQSPAAGFPNPLYRQQELDWSVQQMIPFPGKRAAMARPEELRADMLEMERRRRTQQFARRFKDAYRELWSVEERLRLRGETIRNLSEFAEVAQVQFGGGMGSQAEVLRARGELAAARVDSTRLSRERASMQAMLLALMDRPFARTLDSVEAPLLPISQDTETREETLDSTRPDLGAMRISAEMNQAMAAAARRELAPDFMVRGMYKQMLEMDRDWWSLMVGVTVPIAPWSASGVRATVRQRELEARRDQLEARSMRNMAAAEARAARNDRDASLEAARVADSILIPQADLAWRSAASSYREGKGDLLMLLDAHRMALMARERRIMDAMKALRSQDALDEAVGIDHAAPGASRSEGGAR